MKILTILAILSVMPSVDVDTNTITGSLPPKLLAAPAQPIVPPQDKPEALTLQAPAAAAEQISVTCRPGARVEIPDGREGEVTSYTDGICRVLAYGEAYVSLWQDDMLELVYPQKLARYQFGH